MDDDGEGESEIEIERKIEKKAGNACLNKVANVLNHKRT